MKSQLQLLLTQEDESRLSQILRVECPGIVFLDDNIWRETPVYRKSIQDCISGRVYLYKGILEDLPVMHGKGEDLIGPTAGCVIQILRPKLEGDLLLSGRVAAGMDNSDKEMCAFVSVVWKCIHSIGTVGVLRFDDTIDEHYIVGHDANHSAIDGSIILADRATRMQYGARGSH